MDPRIRGFLSEERLAWRPFEALGMLDDAQLDEPVAAAHDWSGRDVIGHLVGWLDDAMEVAAELVAGPTSPARERSRREFAARGDEINAEIQAASRELPMDEVRRLLRELPEELRRAVAAVPRSSWDADPANLEFFRTYTTEHYDDHAADLRAVMDAARARESTAGA